MGEGGKKFQGSHAVEPPLANDHQFYWTTDFTDQNDGANFHFIALNWMDTQKITELDLR